MERAKVEPASIRSDLPRRSATTSDRKAAPGNRPSSRRASAETARADQPVYPARQSGSFVFEAYDVDGKRQRRDGFRQEHIATTCGIFRGHRCIQSNAGL